MAKVGKKLREIRQRRGLGVRDVALRAGVSASTISLVERDRISPSIDTLGAIVEALGTTLKSFFSDFPARSTASPFYLKDEHVEIGKVGSISYTMVGINHPNRDILLMRERYAPSADTGSAITHAAQECGIVIRGRVEVTVGDEAAVLKTGDGYYFDSRSPHRFRNVGNGECEIISAVSPPTY